MALEYPIRELFPLAVQDGDGRILVGIKTISWCDQWIWVHFNHALDLLFDLLEWALVVQSDTSSSSSVVDPPENAMA